MRVFFKTGFIEMPQCPSVDEARPVVVKLNKKGVIELLNYDYEVINIYKRLGISLDGISLSKCDKLKSSWSCYLKDIINQHRDYRFYVDGFDSVEELEFINLLEKNAHRVANSFKKTAVSALEISGYRKPSTTWVDEAGAFIRFRIRDVSQIYKDYGSVIGKTSTVWHPTKVYSGTLLQITIVTTVEGYITMLNKIPSGLIYDPKKDMFCIVASICDVINKNKIIVNAGKQSRGLSITTRNALVEKSKTGDWLVKKWF